MSTPLVEDPLLATKLAVPHQAPGLVRRQRLMRRLASGTEGPLTLVAGGAGFGKTALVASWAAARQTTAPVVWVRVDEDDTPGVFWAYLVEGLRRHGVLADADLGRPVRTDAVARGLLVRLASLLERLRTPVVLVVDGLDRIPGAGVHRDLRFLVEHAGPALHLVLISREDPALPLHRYRAEGLVHEIRERDLAFTRGEAAQLLRGQGLTVDDGVVELLLRRTEGWAAGLRLCALAMTRSDDPAGFARCFGASEQAVSDYLLTEVLATQPAASRELLLRTAVLNPVHPELATALTGREDSEQVLQDLVLRHAFVEPLASPRWYRFHPLFAEVLRAHLRSRQPGLEPWLHRTAARWYVERGRTAEAVTEAAAGGDWAWAAARTVEHLMVAPMVVDPGASPSADTFARMPAATPGPAPALVAAACCLTRHDTSGCRSWLARAERRAERRAEPPGRPPERSGRLTAALLGLLSAPAGADDTQARRVAALMAHLPPEERRRHPEIEPLRLYGLACVRRRAGELQAAREGLDEAVRACTGDTTVLLRHRCLGRLGLADAAAGALARAQDHATASLDVADRHSVPDAHRSGAAGLALAAVALERAELLTAATELDRCEQLPDTCRDPDLATERLVLRSRLATSRGQAQDALDLLDALTPAVGSEAAGSLAEARATAALARGDPGTAVRVLEEVPVGPPSRTVLLAEAHLAAGDARQALHLVAEIEGAEDATLPDRVRLALLRAHHTLLEGDEPAARDRFVQALDLARRELLRRPFTEAGPWVRHLLRGLDGRSSSCAWVTAEPSRPGAVVVEALSPREREVLQQVARMLSTEEAAAELGLSVNTVKTHLRSAYHKLGASRRRDAVERARELHML
ncbi:LuxR C-terminal-related transcriptional regulator [Streptomyces antimicrobicus]|uniref:LuxR C-terminal-related transcriptional regulator n=1 Tax=Streptomyces antimicrobicus TaxID=2883108 RepID=A0ABS8B490_9ACTN|nr:LuxR C-terminal-related transcriptional regulator [Streptomyces antimicrobicus]MCB5179423.1 LuxR C-terminal-related transcriptional regulator [Streptomyces antimicrobicus]